MNRRQFLTGASAAAIAAVLPAVPAQPFVAVDLAVPGSERMAIHRVFFENRFFWIGGGDQIIHFSELCDPDCFADMAERYKETERAMRSRVFPIESEDCDDD